MPHYTVHVIRSLRNLMSYSCADGDYFSRINIADAISAEPNSIEPGNKKS